MTHYLLTSGVDLWCPLCGSKSGKPDLAGKFSDGAIGYHYHCTICNYDFVIFDNKDK